MDSAQLRLRSAERAACSTFERARGSVLECAAILDALISLGIRAPHAAESDALLVRIVSMLTKMVE
jgi:hypothetical protein